MQEHIEYQSAMWASCSSGLLKHGLNFSRAWQKMRLINGEEACVHENLPLRCMPDIQAATHHNWLSSETSTFAGKQYTQRWSPRGSCLVSRHRFASLGLGSALATLCLRLASVSNQMPWPWLSLVIFGSASTWSRRFRLDLARNAWVSNISGICSAFGKWVLHLNCSKRQTLTLRFTGLSLRYSTFCFLWTSIFRPQSLSASALKNVLSTSPNIPSIRWTSSTFHKVVQWYFSDAVGKLSRLQFVLFWDKANNHQYVLVVLLKIKLFLDFPR